MRTFVGGGSAARGSAGRPDGGAGRGFARADAGAGGALVGQPFSPAAGGALGRVRATPGSADAVPGFSPGAAGSAVAGVSEKLARAIIPTILSGRLYFAPVPRSCTSARPSVSGVPMIFTIRTRRSGCPEVRNVITSPTRGPAAAVGAGGGGGAGDCPIANVAEARANAPKPIHRAMPRPPLRTLSPPRTRCQAGGASLSG